MTGWLHVSTEAVEQPDALERWVVLGLRCARAL
jgi:hypothetical protein